jgi:DNA-binding winged helix-turn-helix (wHTH) protein
MKLILGSCQVDLATRVVSDGDQEQERLTSTEVALLAYLVDHSPNIVSREELYREVWEHTATLQTRTLDLAVLRLRKKIEADSKNPLHILTVYGQGYCFIPSGGQTGNLQPVSEPRPQSNLEREENRFIGRQQELDALDALSLGGSPVGGGTIWCCLLLRPDRDPWVAGHPPMYGHYLGRRCLGCRR